MKKIAFNTYLLLTFFLLSSGASLIKENREIHILFKEPSSKSRRLALQLIKQDFPLAVVRSYSLVNEIKEYKDLYNTKQNMKGRFFIGPDHDDPLYRQYPKLVANVGYIPGSKHFYTRDYIADVRVKGFELERWKDLIGSKSKNKKFFTYVSPFYAVNSEDCSLKERVYNGDGDYHTYIIYKVIESLLLDRPWSLSKELTLIDRSKGIVNISMNLKARCLSVERFYKYLSRSNLKIIKTDSVAGISLH